MFKDFHWDNETKIVKEGDNAFILEAYPQTDYIINPVDGSHVLNAAYYYKMVTGDFVLQGKVSHEFLSTFDACAFLVVQDDETWGKICFEKSDFGTNAVVSVVTKGTSDDANGVNIDGKMVWLKMIRKGNAFSLHYSLEGEIFYLSRIFNLECDKTIKVGFAAQSPVGDGGKFLFEHIKLENRSVKDMRTGL